MQQMSAALHEQPEPSDENFFDATEQLDVDRDVFLMASARFAELPTRRRLHAFTESSQRLASSFYTAVQSSITDELEISTNPSWVVKQAITMLKNEDASRVKFWLDLAPKAPLKLSEDFDELESALLQSLEKNEKSTFTTMVLNCFIHGLEVDSNNFAEHISQTKKGKYIEVGKLGLKEILDVSKIGAGVVLGLAVMRKFTRE